jgi:hypothetical protein
MKTLLAILIATSLTANAWLAFRSATLPAAVEERLPESSPPRASSAGGDVPLSALGSSDPAVWRDRLRAAGADEATVRSLVEGGLRQRYEEKLTALRVERNKSAWWRNEAGGAGGDDARLMRETVLTPLRELMGRDPLDLQDAEKRFDFLPPEKRRRLAEIELDYAELAAAAGVPRPSAINALKSDVDRDRLLAEERRKDVLAALTPAERAEYDLRFEGSAGFLSGRFEAMQGTEQEFRALRPVLDEMRERERTLPRGDAFSVEAYEELQQEMLDKIAAAIGPERAIDYQWSGPGLYTELRRIAQERGLPATMAGGVMQLAAETGARASAIHHDAAIPSEQKPAALLALQAAVRKDFDRLLPERLRAEFPAEAVEWFMMLGEGRYMGYAPNLRSTGSGTVAATSIVASVRGRTAPPPPRPKALGK